MTDLELSTCIIVWKHHLATTSPDIETRHLIYATIKHLEELKELKGE